MSPKAYIDCFLKITAHDRATFEFAGQDYSGNPRLDPALLQPLLLTAGVDATRYGIALFKSVFPADDDLVSGYRSALSMSRQLNNRLRFHLQIDVGAPPDLLALNWERLYDEKEKQSLGRWTQTAFSRFTGLHQPPPDPIAGKPKLLVVISSPTGLDTSRLEKIDTHKVRDEVKEALAPFGDGLEYEFLEGPATRSKIRESLKNGFHAVHIQAHGLLYIDGSMTRLVLETENGEADPIDEDFFREIFSGLPNVQLVVLMACHSGAHIRDDPFGGLALTLVQQNLPAVIAMQQPITFQAAKIFNKYFYGELARHGQLDAAINEARLHVRLDAKGSEDWSSPVLFMRSQDSRLWNLTPTVEVRETEGPVATEEDTFWDPILKALQQGQLVPIIGPDINHGLLPSNVEITRRWSRKYEYEKVNYPLNDRNDLPRVARFVEAKSKSPRYPHRVLQTLLVDDLLEREKTSVRAKFKNKSLPEVTLPEVISDVAQRYFDKDVDAPHRILADLRLSTYLTTAPDNFMAEALRLRGRPPQKQVLYWQEGDREPDGYQLLKGSVDSPLVWHLYGRAPNAGSLVLTEDDHLDFLRNLSADPWRRPAGLMETLTEGLLLFLGFNVRDLDFRVLFKGLISHLKVGSGRIAILQVQPEKTYQERELDLNLLQSFLEQDSSDFKVNIRWLTVREFLIQLRDKSQKE